MPVFAPAELRRGKPVRAPGARLERIEREALAALQAVAGRPWRWGECDCTFWIADYVYARVGADPAAPYRGAYSDEAGAEALLAAHGGLVGLLDKALGAVGIGRAEEPAYGDLGVIWIPSTPVFARLRSSRSYDEATTRLRRGEPAGGLRGAVPVTGLYLGRRWACRSARGIAVFARPAVAVWRVGSPPRSRLRRSAG